MNKFLLIAVVGAALFAAVRTHADPLPGPYVGLWCFVNDNSQNQSGTPGEKTCSGIFNTRAIRTLKINLKGYEWTNADATDGILCKFVSIKHTGEKRQFQRRLGRKITSRPFARSHVALVKV